MCAGAEAVIVCCSQSLVRSPASAAPRSADRSPRGIRLLLLLLLLDDLKPRLRSAWPTDDRAGRGVDRRSSRGLVETATSEGSPVEERSFSARCSDFSVAFDDRELESDDSERFPFPYRV